MSTDDQNQTESEDTSPVASSAPAAPKTSIGKLLGIALLAVAVAGGIVGFMFWKEMNANSNRETYAIDQVDGDFTDPRMMGDFGESGEPSAEDSGEGAEDSGEGDSGQSDAESGDDSSEASSEDAGESSDTTEEKSADSDS